MISRSISGVYALFFSEVMKKRFERFVFLLAIIAFIVHFSLIVWTSLRGAEGPNPISAIYTPFTIILLYEVYLLIYYLPQSITIYLGKQYEIITLIFIRKLFSDLAYLASAGPVFDRQAVLALLVSFGGLLVLCLLIFLFYKLSGVKGVRTDEEACADANDRRFVKTKKVMALGLMAIFTYMFVKSLVDIGMLYSTLRMDNVLAVLNEMNNRFFDTFFSILILTEVLLLLFTFDLSDDFSKVIRNSGFIISTILLKLSFRASGMENVAIILVAVAFGVSILAVHRLFSRLRH